MTKTSFKKWYDTNKDEYNRQRREKYRTDKEHREKVKEQAYLSMQKSRGR